MDGGLALSALPPPAPRLAGGADRGRRGVVRGCPLGTAQDRCEWHASGTAGEDDPDTRGAVGSQLGRWVRPALSSHRVVGKPRTRRGSVFRSRPVADGFGAPVPRDQGPIGQPGTGRPILALTPCMPWTACRRERCCSRALALVMARSRLSAWDRCCPLVSPGSCPNHAPGAVELGILIRLPAASKPTTPTTRCSSMIITTIPRLLESLELGRGREPMLDSLRGSLRGSRPCLLVTGPSGQPSSDRREEEI